MNCEYFDGVDGGLVGNERGEETLVAQFADVAGHVTAVHQNLQIARTGRRSVN